jgi:hypothetical protein
MTNWHDCPLMVVKSRVVELDSQGHSQPEIAKILQVSIGTINRDLSILRQQAKENIKIYIDERLPEEYEKCLVGLNAITKEAWTTAANTEDKREKIQALSLAKECYSMKLDLLTNATVVDDAIRFVSQKSQQGFWNHHAIAMKIEKNQMNLIMMKIK